MQVTVTAAEPTVIAAGPVSVLVRNTTTSSSVFLEASTPSEPATVDTGFEWMTTDPALSIDLAHGQVLTGIVAVGGPDQVLHLLRTALGALA